MRSGSGASGSSVGGIYSPSLADLLHLSNTQVSLVSQSFVIYTYES